LKGLHYDARSEKHQIVVIVIVIIIVVVIITTKRFHCGYGIQEVHYNEH